MFRITNASRLTAARGIRPSKDGKVPQTVSSPILKNCGRSEWQERWAAPQHPTIGGGRLWAGCTASVEIDVAQARSMNMRPDKDCSGRARNGAKQVGLPRDARLTRKNAPENGAIEDTDPVPRPA